MNYYGLFVPILLHFRDEKMLVKKMFDNYEIFKQLCEEEDDEWLLQIGE